jgi:hypothetical protein
MAVYAFGHPGKWWADVMGTRYPCVGAMRIKNNHYQQAYSLDKEKSWNLIEQIEELQKVIVREEILQANGIYKVIGYVGLFHVLNFIVTITETHKIVDFDLGPKIVTIKNR